MEQPLGYAVGNWLEVKESIEGLQGDGPADVMEISHLLAGTMIHLGKQASTIEEGIEKSRRAVSDGSAFRKWVDIVRAHGGDTRVIETQDGYNYAEFRQPVRSPKSGYITAMDAFAMGMVSLELGAGRRSKEASVDPAAGFILRKKVGDFIEQDETFAVLHTNNDSMLKPCGEAMINAISISADKPEASGNVALRVDRSGIHEQFAQ